MFLDLRAEGASKVFRGGWPWSPKYTHGPDSIEQLYTMSVVELALLLHLPLLVLLVSGAVLVWRSSGVRSKTMGPVGSRMIPCHFYQGWFSASSFPHPAVMKIGSEVTVE